MSIKTTTSITLMPKRVLSLCLELKKHTIQTHLDPQKISNQEITHKILLKEVSNKI